VAGLLNFFFVGAEIKKHICLRHDGSLRRAWRQVKMRGGGNSWLVTAKGKPPGRECMAKVTSLRHFLPLKQNAIWLIIYATGMTVRAANQNRGRAFGAWVCLLTAIFLYAPLAGAAWSARSMACCTGDRCDIPQHHHRHQAADNQIDCGHDTTGMIACSMSCCQNTDTPVVTAVAFVLPRPAGVAQTARITRTIENAHASEIPRSIRPASPPPRFAHLWA
jgi:hypothetical protein